MILQNRSQDSGCRIRRRSASVVMTICLLVTSCRSPLTRPRYHGEAKSAEYFNRATNIAYPQLDEPDTRLEHFAYQPRTIRHQAEDQIWDLRLDECIQIALSNSRIIRNQAQFSSSYNPVLSGPESVATVYDPAIQTSGVLFGQRGVEAALSDFDAQFTTQMLWGRNELVQNNTISLGLPAGDVLSQETGSFSSSLQKNLATGGTVSVSHNWNYTGSNIGTPPLLFPSVYDGSVQFQFRQPLLAGAGVEYTRIAGPVTDNIQGVSGVSQGVIIARINDDIALADFERNVHQLLHDLEVTYWQLQLAYRTYALQVEARDFALEIWQAIDSQVLGNSGPGGALEAELRDNYLAAVTQADDARDAIYATEAQLRLLMALSVNDGRVIRPADEPITAEFYPDWSASLAHAFQLRPEIRRQKWSIRSIDLQRRAAENLTMPRLDFVSGYQINGFGDDLFDQGGGTSTGQYASAYQNLLSRHQTGWNLGLQFSVPVGRRYAFAQLRSMELRLAKAQVLLAEQETEISHQIAAAFRDIDRNFSDMKTAYNRQLVSRERLTISRAQYESNSTQYTIEMVARAQQALVQAELAFVNSLIRYNTSLADLQYKTGRTLLANNIHLQEGAWQAEAEVDAQRNFDARAHAIPRNHRITTPEVLSEYPPFLPDNTILNQPEEAEPTPASPEENIQDDPQPALITTVDLPLP